MALRKFTPDPELFDPQDPEGWIGTWEHDDGSSLYGQGDPELGEPLMAGSEPDQRLAMNADEQDPTDPPLDFDDPSREVSDVPAPVLPGPPPSIARPPEQGPAPAAPAAPQERADWENDVPPQVAATLRQQATDAGLSPDALAGIISHESGWNPAAVNAKTGKHAGLIQFSEAGWPAVAKAAGRPDVTWEEMRGMSAEDQIPFAVAYYKDKGLKPESGIADYAMQTFMPAYAGQGDDFVLGEKGSNEMRGDVRSGKVWEQNQGLDLDKDGRITKGEVGQAYGGKAGLRGAPGAAPVPGAAPAVPGAAPGGMPGAVGGLPLHEVTMQGMPQTPEQLAQAQQNVAGRYAAQMGAHQQAEQLRAQGARDAMALVEKNHAEQTANREAELQRRTAAVAEAQAMVDRDVNAPIKEIDPKQYIKNMSTGDKILGAIAIVISAIGQAANSMIGVQSGNTALQVLQGQIEQNIDKQREALARGDKQAAARLAHWQTKLGNEEDAISALRAEQKMAAASMLQTRAQAILSDANQKAQGDEYAATMFAEGQAEVQKITDRRADSIVAKYAPPTGVKADPDKLVKLLQAGKEARQELLATGQYTEAQVDKILEANGFPAGAARGETVPQQTAREGVERDQDEKTSKELEDIANAENAVRLAQKRLEGLAENWGVNESVYDPNMIGAGVVGTLTPGLPDNDEVVPFRQSIEDLVLKAGKAVSGADVPPEQAKQIRTTILGDGSIKSMRAGLAQQLEQLRTKREYISTRRGSSAQRLNQRLQNEGPRPVTAPVYIQGQGPLR